MPVKIKGNEYSTVAERLNAIHDDYDYVSINTEIVDEIQEHITIKAVSRQLLGFTETTLNRRALAMHESILSLETRIRLTTRLHLRMRKHQLLAEPWLVQVMAVRNSLPPKRYHGSKTKPRLVKARSIKRKTNC